jgi:chromosome segregation ATPase
MISSTAPVAGSITVESGHQKFTWEDTKDAMHQLMECYNDERFIKNAEAVLKQYASEVAELADVTKQIQLDGDEICSDINSKIKECSRNFSQEEENLREILTHISNLQDEVNDIRNGVNESKEQEDEIRRKIILYNEQASERVVHIDEVELRKKEEVYRLQTQISLHAHVTGIKWDYEDIDSIKGEIDIPSKQIQKRFEIDREGKSDFEIVNSFWTMMEA